MAAPDPSSYHALIPVKIIDGLEAYVVADKPIMGPGASNRIHVVGYNYGDVNKVKKIQVYLAGGGRRVPVYGDTVEFPSGKTRVVSADLPGPEEPGRYALELYVDDKKYDSASLLVADPGERRPFLLAFVWHHHQAPNYTVDGKIHSPWAYIYVWGSHLAPYGLGPYHFHAVLLDRIRGFRATYNLSPSLLEQWRMIIEEGVEFTSGEKYAPDSPEAARVRETLDLYRAAVSRGQIDVLTSIYAHTIAGYLAEVLDMDDVVEEELVYGRGVTERVIGGGYRALGAWTPEMAFSMKLVDIYARNNIEYTVLDDQHHFMGAVGDKAGPREPYILVNPATGSHITVFFRDHVLSDILGFNNNFYDEPHAWRNAYETALRISEQWFDGGNRVLTLALDGENWMVFPKNPPQTAFYLEKLVRHLQLVEEDGFLRTAGLRNVLEKEPPRRVLKHVPLNSWLGGFRKWRGEVAEHEEMWFRAVARYRLIRGYERVVGRDEYSSRARWALWHALDSDYWWAEFWKPETINMWLAEVDRLVAERLGRLSISVEREGDAVEGEHGFIRVVVENGLEKEARPAILVCGSGIEVEESVKPVSVKPGSTYTRLIRVRYTKWGNATVFAGIVADGYIVAGDMEKIYVKPRLPPNPF